MKIAINHFLPTKLTVWPSDSTAIAPLVKAPACPGAPGDEPREVHSHPAEAGWCFFFEMPVGFGDFVLSRCCIVFLLFFCCLYYCDFVPFVGQTPGFSVDLGANYFKLW